MQNEGHSLVWRQAIQDHLKGHPDGFGEFHFKRRIRCTLSQRDLSRGGRHALAQSVEAQTNGHRREPRWKVVNGGVGAVEAQPRLLHRVFGFGRVTQYAGGHAQ